MRSPTEPRRRRLALGLGIAAWLVAAAATPGEVADAKRRAPIGPRTALVLVLYLGAALGILRGLAAESPPNLPRT